MELISIETFNDEQVKASIVQLRNIVDLEVDTILFTPYDIFNIPEIRNDYEIIAYSIDFHFKNNSFQHIIFGLSHDFIDRTYFKNTQAIIKILIEQYNYTIDCFKYVFGINGAEYNEIVYKKMIDNGNYYQVETFFVNYIPAHFIKTEPRNFDMSKSKKFLSMNRNPRPHRVAMTMMLLDSNLIDNSYYSIYMWDIFYEALPKSEYADKLNMNFREIFVNNIDLINKFRNGISINLHEYPNVRYPINENDMHFFNSTWFSLIQETLYSHEYDYENVSEADYFIITEKTWRPIIHMHPFVILGTAYFLQELRKLGFKTFSPWIDESYDLIEDGFLRLKAVYEEVKRLTELSDSEWEEIYKNIIPILKHNYQLISKVQDILTIRRVCN